jgi:hypothetical protein
VPPGDVVEPSGVGIAPSDGGAQLIEVADHCSRRVEVEFPAWQGADAEAVSDPRRDEDERTRRAQMGLLSNEEVVLALEDVERLRGVPVDV